MKFENQFEVGAPLDEVWEAVLDVERVTPNVPGAQVLERTADNAYKVSIKVKVGPMSMTYRGDVEIVERDDEARRAVMRARAKEARGQGTANADVVMQLEGTDGRTRATVTTDVALTGRVASMGRGMLEDVSGRLIRTFAENLAVMLEGPPAPAPEPAQPAVGAGAAAPPPGQAPGAAPPPPAPEPGAAAAEPGAAAPPPRPEPEEALDLGAMGGAMLLQRLSDPKVLGPLAALVALIAFLLGRRSAR